MGQSFSFKRSLLLFKLIFINNINNPIFKRMWISLLVMIVILNIGSISTGTFNLINPLSVPISFTITAMFGLILTLRGYEHYIDKLNVCTSYMLPASVNEKFFIPLFSSIILITGMFFVVYAIWYLLQLTIIGGREAFEATITNIQNDFSIISLFVTFLFTNSLCCLFSVLFKNSISTVFIIIGFSFVMISESVRGMSSDSEQISYLSSLPVSFWYCGMIMLSLFFWFVAYCIFRGQQLNK